LPARIVERDISLEGFFGRLRLCFAGRLTP